MSVPKPTPPYPQSEDTERGKFLSGILNEDPIYREQQEQSYNKSPEDIQEWLKYAAADNEDWITSDDTAMKKWKETFEAWMKTPTTNVEYYENYMNSKLHLEFRDVLEKKETMATDWNDFMTKLDNPNPLELIYSSEMGMGPDQEAVDFWQWGDEERQSYLERVPEPTDKERTEAANQNKLLYHDIITNNIYFPVKMEDMGQYEDSTKRALDVIRKNQSWVDYAGDVVTQIGQMWHEDLTKDSVPPEKTIEVEVEAETKEAGIAPEVAKITPEEDLEAIRQKNIASEEAWMIEKKERAETATYISGYEGYIETPRTLPNEKHRTVGIGHLLDGSKRSRAAFKKAFSKKNYNEYKNGTGTLTQEEAQKLFQEDLPDYIKQAKKLTGDKFETYSNNLRKNLISATYRGSWGQSPKARKLLTEGKFEESATEFLNNDEYRNAVKLNRAGIRPRMEAVAKAIRDEAVAVLSTVPADDPIHHILPTNWEQARGALGMAGVNYFVIKHILTSEAKSEAQEKLVDSINKKWREGLHSYTDEESKWLQKKMRGFYKRQSKAAQKAMNKASRKPLIKSVGKLLGKVAGKVIPGGAIVALLFGGSADADMIAAKLTQDQMDVLERVKRDVEKYGISQTEALIYHQLGAFARSPGTKM
jgi:hypothetical protein